MKHLKILAALMFSMVLAVVFGSVTQNGGIAFAAFALSMSASFGLPALGIVGENFVGVDLTGLSDQERAFAEKFNNAMKSLIHNRDSKLITEDQFKIRLADLTAGSDKMGTELRAELKKINEETLKELENLKGMIENRGMDNESALDFNMRQINELIPKLTEAYDNQRVSEFKIKLRANTDVVGMGKIDTAGGIYPDAYMMPGINEKPTVKNILFSLANKIPIPGKDTIKWLEEVAVEGTAGMTAENALKSQISQSWKTAKADVQKATAFTKATDEMIRFAPLLWDRIKRKIIQVIEDKVDIQLFEGTGADEQINGIKKYAKTVNLAGLADSVVKPTMIEAIQAGITQMYESSHGVFVPNAIFVRPVDYFKMRTTKNADGTPIIPGWMMSDGLKIDDVPIYKTTASAIATGYFMIADTTKLNVGLASELEIVVGLSGDDFIYNRATVRGERYLASFVEGNDADAFIYDSFANVLTFIEKSTT